MYKVLVLPTLKNLIETNVKNKFTLKGIPKHESSF